MPDSIQLDYIDYMLVAPGGDGYWLVSAHGKEFPFGSAKQLQISQGLQQPRVLEWDANMWVSSDGAVRVSPRSMHYGDRSGKHLNGRIIDAVVIEDGYWLVGVDGGVFCFGAAQFYGSLGGDPRSHGIDPKAWETLGLRTIYLHVPVQGEFTVSRRKTKQPYPTALDIQDADNP